MAILSKGAAAAAIIAEEEKKNRPGGFFRVPDLVVKDGDSYLLRFVTEITDLTTMSVHRFTPTKAKPEQCDWDKWPEKMWAVCQNDNAFRVRDGQGNLTDEFEEGYGNCYICNLYRGQTEVVKYGGKSFKKDKGRPDVLTYGVAVMFKVTTDSATGNPTGLTEELVEYKPAEDVTVDGEVIAKKGEIIQLPKLVLAAQRYDNFWHPVQATSFLPPHLIRDKVFTVSRKDKDFTVTVVSTDPAGAQSWLKYEQALAIIGFNHDEHLLDHATPDHYAKFFDPDRLPADGYKRKSSDDGEEASAESQPAATAQSGPNVDMAALSNFAGRLAGRGKAAASS